jgi:hypothetical protein
MKKLVELLDDDVHFFSNGPMLMLLCSHRLYWSRYFGVLLDFCSDNRGSYVRAEPKGD